MVDVWEIGKWEEEGGGVVRDKGFLGPPMGRSGMVICKSSFLMRGKTNEGPMLGLHVEGAGSRGL